MDDQPLGIDNKEDKLEHLDNYKSKRTHAES